MATVDIDFVRESIMRLVCEEFQVTEQQIKNCTRGIKPINQAKFVYTYLTRKYLKSSVIRISMDLNVNHCTVSHHLKRIRDFERDRDPIINRIQKIEQQLFKTKINRS